MPAFSPFFVVDIHSKLRALDVGELEYEAEVARQKAAVPEAELQADARTLIKDIAKVWSHGVYSVIGLGELLEEKQRRLRQDGHWGLNDRVAAWLRECMRLPEDDVDLHALPSPHDCFKLIDKVAYCGDDGLGRPAFFFDIAD